MTLTAKEKKEFDDYYLTEEKCPACGSTEVLRIVVGRPTPQLVEWAEENSERVKMAGCMPPPDADGKMVTHECKSCGKQFSNE